MQANVSVPSPNERSVFETATNGSERVSGHEISDDKIRLALLLNLPVSINVIIPT